MNNDIDYALGLDPSLLLFMFRYPMCMHPQTLRTLAAENPDMAGRVLQACIAANYENLYDELKEGVSPHLYLMRQAMRSGNM